MILVIITPLIMASSMATGSEMISATATATFTSIIAIVIIIASVGGIDLSTVALVLASIIILMSPSPLLRTSIWFPTTVLTPVGSTASVVTSIFLVVIVITYIFILLILLKGRGRWLRLLLRFGFTFTFLSSCTSCAFKWFG